MSTIFNLIFHGSALAFVMFLIWSILRLVLDSSYIAERNVRIIAILTGLLLYGGLRAIGLSFPFLASTFTGRSISGAVFGILIPLTLGTFFARLMLLLAGASNPISIRLTLLLLGFSVTGLFDLWWEATLGTNPTINKDAVLLPLVSFVIGFCVLFVVRFREPNGYSENERHNLKQAAKKTHNTIGRADS